MKSISNLSNEEKERLYKKILFIKFKGNRIIEDVTDEVLEEEGINPNEKETVVGLVKNYAGAMHKTLGFNPRAILDFLGDYSKDKKEEEGPKVLIGDEEDPNKDDSLDGPLLYGDEKPPFIRPVVKDTGMVLTDKEESIVVEGNKSEGPVYFGDPEEPVNKEEKNDNKIDTGMVLTADEEGLVVEGNESKGEVFFGDPDDPVNKEEKDDNKIDTGWVALSNEDKIVVEGNEPKDILFGDPEKPVNNEKKVDNKDIDTGTVLTADEENLVVEGKKDEGPVFFGDIEDNLEPLIIKSEADIKKDANIDRSPVALGDEDVPEVVETKPLMLEDGLLFDATKYPEIKEKPLMNAPDMLAEPKKDRKQEIEDLKRTRDSLLAIKAQRELDAAESIELQVVQQRLDELLGSNDEGAPSPGGK